MQIIGREAAIAQSTAKTEAPRCREKIAYFVAFITLLMIRMPHVLQKGRFWAEEGSIFFMRAWHLPWQEVLLAPYFGYLNLAANMAALLAAHVLPLTLAPYASTLFALIIQSCPAILLLLSNRPWLQHRAMLIAGLLLIATPPVSEEVWLSSIGSQCHLNLCVGLILALEPLSGRKKIFEYLLLALAPLSGPGAGVFLPFFILRVFLEKSWARSKQAIVLTVAAAIQFLFFFSFEARPVGINPKLLLEVFFAKHLLVPFLGRDEATTICARLLKSFLSGQTFPLLSAGVLLVSAIVMVVLARQKIKDALWLFCSAIAIAALSYYGALGDRYPLLLVDNGERYSYAPQVMLALSMLCLWATSNGIVQQVARLVTIWLLVIGMHEYFWIPPKFADGPRWSTEVHKWQADPKYTMKLWPQGWEVRLDKDLVGKQKEVLAR